LEKYIFFVSKQPTLVELSDVHQVVFSRVGASTAARTFDLKIVTKSGPEYTFTSLNKEEHELTETYLKDKKIKIKNEMVQDVDIMLATVVEDEDEEMQSVASSDDEPSKPRLGGDDEDSEEGS
jgi:structure-specific recognition protein 1